MLSPGGRSPAQFEASVILLGAPGSGPCVRENGDWKTCVDPYLLVSGTKNRPSARPPCGEFTRRRVVNPPTTSPSLMTNEAFQAMLVNPARSGSATDIECSEGVAASATEMKPERSLLTAILARHASPQPRAHQPTISELPARGNPAYQEGTITLLAAGASKSPLTQEVKVTADPNHVGATAPHPRTAPIDIPLQRRPSFEHIGWNCEPYSKSHPRMRYKPSKTGDPYYTTFTYPTCPFSGRFTFAQHEASTPPRLREKGWVEVHLPDSYMYYVNPAARIVADVEMRNDSLFHAVSKHLELEQHKNALESAVNGAELWLRDAGSAKKGFKPVRWWVIHKERKVVFYKVFKGAKLKVLRKEDRECFA